MFVAHRETSALAGLLVAVLTLLWASAAAAHGGGTHHGALSLGDAAPAAERLAGQDHPDGTTHQDCLQQHAHFCGGSGLGLGETFASLDAPALRQSDLLDRTALLTGRSDAPPKAPPKV